MPKVVESVTRLTISIPSEVFDLYEAEAKEKGKSIESVMATRLAKCATHRANQGIYFDDNQRQQLVHLTGGHLINNADDALGRIKSQAAVKVGTIEFNLDQRRLTRLVARAKAERKTPEVVAEREFRRGLDQFVGMG